ncbi:Alpha/Beta hydrolase protein [Talaromyces proteolyticus]|uniref:Alpha/Beta hydrolase protein n=1 Tax=Talaromyces proteolyticus TaxID=1131652 RepID=A0AAD4PTW2_9EURO|nr:Alpha/Beta hydrolase protein [Talaromyces proteolyticus]KAH8691460.1 Alpha/Beta hydrolase protein [Talaromyces proteolyticus]
MGEITEVDDSNPLYIARINEEIELKDGSRIRANVFLPRSGGPRWPVLMSSSPYGKDVPLMDRRVAAVPEEQRSKHTRFEAPVPSWWCTKGYVLVYHDHRGSSQSPGFLAPFSSQHYDDYAEIVTWAADQHWSTGKVGLTGISYLALNQWFVAARQPRGLCCIVPWEGMADLYRDATRHGGITCTGMNNFWFERAVRPVQYGKGRELSLHGPDSPEGNLTEDQLSENRENFPELVLSNEFIDDEFYKRCGACDFSKITVPLLSAGNWGGILLHLRGNILGWMRAGSEYKYLRIHTGTHDAPFYSSPAMDLQLSFFDCWLKGDDYGGWKTGKQAPVSFAVRKGNPGIAAVDEKEAFKYRDEKEWPLARTVYKQVNLTHKKELREELQSGSVSLLSVSRIRQNLQFFPSGERILFKSAPAEEAYEICGHPSVMLSMSLTNHPHDDFADIDVYLALRKFDAEGKEVFYTSSLGTPQAVTLGWVRASHRTLSPKPYPEIEGELAWPTLSHRRDDVKRVRPGEIYELLTELWPTNLAVEKGETIALEVSPKDVAESGLNTTNDALYRSEAKLGGNNNIHFGSQYKNYLVLPVV